MFGGSNDNVPAPEQKPFGADEKRLNTIEQARPVPWFAGRRILGVTQVSNLYGVLAFPKVIETKKDDLTAGYDYFASFAGVICHGPVDKVYAIYFDQELVWSGEITRGAEDTVNITIVGRGSIQFYWGTETQGIDATLDLFAQENHSPMRGQCYFNAVLYFGYQRTNAPNIEFELGRWPVVSWLTADVNINGDCNPIHFIAEMAQNQRYGAGMPDDRFYVAGLDAVANQLATEGIGLSPYLNRQINFGEFLQEALPYFDGYRKRTRAGKFSIGLNRAIPEGGEIPVIGVSDLLQAPNLRPPAWETTINQVWVKFSNRNNRFNSDAIPAPNQAARQIVGRPIPKTVNREWITDPDLATRVAIVEGRQRGLPETTGSMAIKKSSAAALSVGQQFILCYPQTRLNLLCRVLEKTVSDPGQPRVDIQYKRDRGYLSSDDLFTPGVEPRTPAPTYAPEALDYQRVVELPYGLRFNAYMPGVGFLTARPTAQTTGLHIHKRKPSGSYEDIIPVANYGQRGHLLEEYPATTTLIDDERGMLVKLDGVDKTLPNFELEDALLNDWLIWIGGEIMSMFDATLTDANTYRISTIRNRYDTQRLFHPNAREVFIIPRSSLSFYQELGSDNPQTYKFQPYVLGSPLALADATATEKTLVYRGLRPWAPKNLRAFGIQTNPTWSTGQDVPITWSDVTPDPTRADVPKIWFEVRSGDSVVHSEEIAAGTEAKTLTNADLVTWLGSEGTFKVRLYHIRTGDWKSTLYAELTITFI